MKLALPAKKRLLSDWNYRDLVLRQENVRLDSHRLSRYRNICETNADVSVPVLFPQVLISPLQIALLSRQTAPFSFLGAVHKYNVIEQYAPVDPDLRFHLQVQIREVRVLEKGLEIELENLLEQDGRVIWSSRSGYFVRGRFPGTAKSAEALPGLPVLPVDAMQPHAQWHLHRRKGLHYARLTGDYNPIHVSKYAARLLGFERDLIHGLCVFATALDRVEPTSSQAMREAFASGIHKIVTTVHFKGPNYLDHQLCLYARSEQGRSRMDLYCAGNTRPTLQAEVQYCQAD